jgi:DNA-binding response OmpR family regulator
VERPVHSGRRSVLIVDAGAGLYDLLRQGLERRGWRAARVGLAEDALEQLEGGRYDLVLIDLRTTRVSGVDAIRRIRHSQDAILAHMPVMAYVPYAGAGEMALAAGADDYLAEPCVPSHLIARMAACARRT